MTFSRKVLALVGAMIMLTPCCAQALNYNWAVTGVDGAALSGTSSSAIGAATALSVAALAHGGCASATETGFAVTSDTGVPGGSWSVSFMYSDTVTETNTIVGSPCNTGGPIGPFSVGGTITGTGLPKDVGKASNQDAVVGDPIVLSIGNKVQTDTDYQAPGPNALQFVRVYNSASIAGFAANFAALNYNWAVTGVDGAALSGTSSSAIGAATALSVAALAHGGCASATETGFAVTSDTGVPGGSWSVSFMYSDTVTETNTIVGSPCNTGGPIGPFSVGGTITGTGLPKDVGKASNQDAVVGDPIVL